MKAFKLKWEGTTECVNGCEFQTSSDEKFFCTLFEDILKYDKKKEIISLIRCQQCIDYALEYEKRNNMWN